MRFLRHAIRKDLRRAAADPLALGLYLGIPLVIGALITFLVAGGRGQVCCGVVGCAWRGEERDTEEDDSSHGHSRTRVPGWS